MTTEKPKKKRKYTTTLKWDVNGQQFSGLTQALNLANELLKTGEAEEVTIKRIKPAKK